MICENCAHKESQLIFCLRRLSELCLLSEKLDHSSTAILLAELRYKFNLAMMGENHYSILPFIWIEYTYSALIYKSLIDSGMYDEDFLISAINSLKTRPINMIVTPLFLARHPSKNSH